MRAPLILDTAGARSFRYESVYFDTPDLLSFRMAAQPRRRRFKLRTRTYLDSRTAFLELKTRGARSATVKDRVEYPASDRRRLTEMARDYAAEGLESIGVGGRRADDLGVRLTTRTVVRRSSRPTARPAPPSTSTWSGTTWPARCSPHRTS